VCPEITRPVLPGGIVGYARTSDVPVSRGLRHPRQKTTGAASPLRLL